MTTGRVISAIYRGMTDVIRANERRGHHWFEPSTKRFFRSRIGQTLYGGRYFVTSEQFDRKSPRLYSVREAMPDGDIKTVGEFQAYSTGAQAIAAINRLLKGQRNGIGNHSQ